MRIATGFVLLAVMVAYALAGQLGSAEPEKLMAKNRVQHLALAADALYGVPASQPPLVLFHPGEDWPHGGLADCAEWSITLSLRDLNRNIDYVLYDLLPHEYAHLVYCYLNGGRVGVDPHNERWAAIARELKR